MTTGTFTCRYPGTYLFHLTLVKKTPQVTRAECYIMINSYADRFSVENSGGGGGSRTVVRPLNINDIVYLGNCTYPQSTMWGSTSFSGVLVTPD